MLLLAARSKNCSFLYTVSSAIHGKKFNSLFQQIQQQHLTMMQMQQFIIYWWLAVGSNYNTGTLRTTWTNNVSADFAAGLKCQFSR
jgi:hypothetical protein